MLLHSNGSNTLRLLERKSGSEIRYNRQIFFANDHLTKVIKNVLAKSVNDNSQQITEETGIDEKTIRLTLDKLSSAGIPLAFWGKAWMGNDNLDKDKDEL